MNDVSFEERVIHVATTQAPLYQSIYVDHEYLLCSPAFLKNSYYILSAKPDNYQHLIGVHSLISAKDFFNKCLSQTLSTSDFDFNKRGCSSKSVKGSVRRKINALPFMMNMLNSSLIVQETFNKNKVSCALASSDNQITVGYVSCGVVRPMTLLLKNELDPSLSHPVSLILRKKAGEAKFNDILVGTPEIFNAYKPLLNALVDERIVSSYL